MSQRPESDALDALVRQFSKRSSFVRELIQNSLDAGAGRIDVLLSEEQDDLLIEVIDDGEGMDREIIERYLLTLFRSSKERDLTKIGKFGVGFVSLFSLNPRLVVVDTGRDGRHYRVIFDADRSYTLAEVDEPFEGTTVRIMVSLKASKRKALAGEIREAVQYWCRYARAEISTEAVSSRWGWPLESLGDEFSVAGPCQIVHEEDGFRAALAFSTEAAPFVGYYNRGLTLLEAHEAAVPGVSFRVEARVLEHTLTRDNVIRDASHRAVLKRVAVLAKTRLRDAHIEAITRAAAAEDWSLHAQLLACAVHADLPGSLPCLRAAGGGLVCRDDLRPGILRRLLGSELLLADGPSPLVTALTASGRIVLLGPLHPEIVRAAQLSAYEPVDVHARWILPGLCAPHSLIDAASDRSLRLVAADFDQRGDAIHGRLVSWQERPGELEHRTTEESPPEGITVALVNVQHPDFRQLEALPEAVAAPLLRHIAHISLGRPEPMAFSTLLALQEARP